MDPKFVDIYRQSGLATQLYYLYLLVMSIYASIRFAITARNLLLKPLRPLGASETENVELIAERALKGLFPLKTHSFLNQIGARFEYLASRTESQLRSTRRLAVCAAIASVIAFQLGLMNTFMFFHGSIELQIAGGMRLTAFASFLGVSISFCTYLAASLLEATLARRRADWNYYCATRLLR